MSSSEKTEKNAISVSNSVEVVKYDYDKTVDVVSVSDIDDKSTRCGYGKCKPNFMQGCASSGVLLAGLCYFVLIETFVQWGLVPVNLSTWERRYDLKSTQSVWIVTTQDLTSAICSPVFGFMAGFWHKGKMVTWAAIGMVVGCFLFLIPQFASQPYALGTSAVEATCNIYDNSTVDACLETSGSNVAAWMSLFVLAQVIWGYVGSCIWTVGITFMDDNCKQQDMVLYLGIFNAISAVGATMGFIGGGLSLEVYVDTHKVDMEEVSLDSTDPGWVGAWWIPFFAAMVFAVPIMFIIPCFPRQLAGMAALKKKERSFVYKGMGEKDDHINPKQTCAALGTAIKWLFTNPIYVLETLAGAIEMGAVTAMATFLPKVIQFQFGQTPSMAAFISGFVIVPAAIIGQLFGGLIPKCFNMNFKQIIWMQSICAYLCIACTFGFLGSCDITPIAGFNTDYPFNSTIPYDDTLIHSCNDQCNCTTQSYDPICDADGMSYFSPCYGGCATEYEDPYGQRMYGNCSCMPNATSPYYQAEEGLCTIDCEEFKYFVAALFIMTILTFMENTGGQAAIMRSVPRQHRAFAFGVQSPIIKLLGTIPMPLIYGYIFDLSCDLWQDNCGEQGSCWIYDNHAISTGLFASGIIVKSIAGTLFLAAVLCYKDPPKDELDSHEVIVEADNKGFDGYYEDEVHDCSKL